MQYRNLQRLHKDDILKHSTHISAKFFNKLIIFDDFQLPNTLLYLTTKELNKDALEIMFSILSSPAHGNLSEVKSLSAKLFGSKSEASKLLAEECKFAYF